MKHLVAALADLSLSDARYQLTEAHDFLVALCLEALATVPQSVPSWGILMKRMHVGLKAAVRPSAVCKEAERFGEVVNMVATLERLIAALSWFERHTEFGGLRVKACHPSTSCEVGSNDLMLADVTGNVVVRCEVCDVASTSAGSNGKERKDITSLGCADGVPADGVRRFICTSPEFARAIQGNRRKWAQCLHRYRELVVGDAASTVLVELLPVAGAEPGAAADGGA